MNFVSQQMARTPSRLLGESILFQGPSLLSGNEICYFFLFFQRMLQLDLYQPHHSFPTFSGKYPVPTKKRDDFLFLQLKGLFWFISTEKLECPHNLSFISRMQLKSAQLTEVNCPKRWPTLSLGINSYLVKKLDCIGSYLIDDYRVSQSPSELSQGQLGKWATELLPTAVLFTKSEVLLTSNS